ncbi:RNA polymerase sigma factor [Cellulosimicrobium sp. CUA-896]|uniref:RNA polymerase sigma factor n=1 Tax=Cellulosimicrobium sp. CUA-896 TaxID=1517881 RepID=UPI0009F829AE|nr:sigma-70 family RNA polymerase sigma factor [Cellulosimicrobium sp. CUA-896]
MTCDDGCRARRRRPRLGHPCGASADARADERAKDGAADDQDHRRARGHRSTRVESRDRGAFALLEYRDGRNEALAEFVREATPLLWHTVRAQGVDREQADDVVQTVWVALVRNAMTIKEPHAVLKWLLITAKRASWEAVRKQRDEARRRTELPDDTDEGVPTLPSSDPTPDVEVLTHERDRGLWRALSRLPERCQTLLKLVSLADRPDYKAISAATGMPVGSIGSTRGRCLAKLRDIIDVQGESWEAS